MARHENITLPKIHKNPTPEERKRLDALVKEMHATPEDKRKLNDDIRKGLVGYIDEQGNPQLYPR